jgi:uncharacterized protein
MLKSLAGIAAAVAMVVSTCSVQQSQELALVAPKRKLLYLTQSAGFRHEVIPFSTGIVKEIGEKSGAFETTIAPDVYGFTAENLKNFDAVMFYTTGELPMSDEQKNAFVHYIQSGHGFVGVHSATDTFYKWEPYLKIIGGYFNDHPWHQVVTVDVVDPSDPIASGLPSSFQINDEIYQISDFQYETSHVLLKLDPGSVDLHKGAVRPRFYGWPLAWTRRDGEGRVFYTGLGHEQSTWEDPRFQKFLLNGIEWAMGDLK